MDNKKKYNGFSLAEALITLFIVSVVTVAAAPTLTKMKAKTPPEPPHGQYACWRDAGGTLRQQRAIERNMDPIRTGGSCTFEPDKRNPSHYLIMMSGGGGAGMQGQYISLYVPRFESNLVNIVPGAAGGNTTLGAPLNVSAVGGRPSVGNGLIAGNVKSCILRSTGAGNCATSCDITSTSRLTGGAVEAVVKTNGCTMADPLNPANTITRMDRLSGFTKNANGSYTARTTNISYDFQMEDTLYTTRTSNASKMREVMSTVPLHRRSAFFATVSNLNPGGLNRPGAVFIVW